MIDKFDVIIIGAGPAGASAASLLTKLGHSTLIIEKSFFPRFAIGESFLPQNMQLFEEAGLLNVFTDSKFRFKDGAEFLYKEKRRHIVFKNKSTPGPETTYQVIRSDFDHLIMQEVEKLGVTVKYGHELQSLRFENQDNFPVKINYVNEHKTEFKAEAKFIMDASGLAKVLPRLLNHKIDYSNQKRAAFFNHITTKKTADFNNDRILITVDEKNPQTWFWTIPLKENYYSFGVITDEDTHHLQDSEVLPYYLNRNPSLKKALGEVSYELATKKMQGYTARSQELYGEHFVLIGNSGEFLDPIFSSGVTLALKSATLATKVIHKKLSGEDYSWEIDYKKEFLKGLHTFQAFVESWYETRLQDIIFAPSMNEQIEKMITGILAGYAWDDENKYTTHSKRRLNALSEICRDLP